MSTVVNCSSVAESARTFDLDVKQLIILIVFNNKNC